jgi:small subunit ribosomal protein S6
MPLYDLMVLLDPGAPSDRQESILRDVQGLLESDGNVVGNYDWGTRRMTFEIDHRPDAAYHLFQFETEPGGALLDRVDHSLKIMDGVLRHRIIRLKDGSPPPPVPRPEGRGAYAAEAEATAGYDADPGPPNVPDEVASPAPAAETAAPAEAPATADDAVADQPAAPAAAETAEQEPVPDGAADDAPSGDAAA